MRCSGDDDDVTGAICGLMLLWMPRLPVLDPFNTVTTSLLEGTFWDHERAAVASVAVAGDDVVNSP